MKHCTDMNDFVNINCLVRRRGRGPDALRADDRGPAGPVLRGPARDRATRGGGRLRDAVPERPLRLASRAIPASRRPTPGRSSPGLARETATIGLGTLVSPVTFRHPGNFVKLVTTVDQMSGGRLEVGVGAGWNESDHVRSACRSRRSRSGPISWRTSSRCSTASGRRQRGWNFDGHQVVVRGGTLVPGPVQSAGRPIGANGRARPRIITGSEGSPRGFRLAARYSDEFNLSSSTPDIAREKQAQLDAACVAAGRDPKSLTRSAMVGVLIGDERRRGGPAGGRPARGAGRVRRTAGRGSTSAGAGGSSARRTRRARWCARYAEAGIERIMLQDLAALGRRDDRPHGHGARRAGVTWPRMPSCGVRRRC